ncbi:DNA mismatch repair protein MSH2 [Akanthomyces lecanii RCEF 1005]|uniref:DNA mismatch repair protein MSH2 n=1 Tax=Akanthomyces lecanii RCEF 1005 TaxID=1081108 RepID=A0A168KKC8_CORDF|nr:DNA mismatch repair protein MSH2 [Akanthomyces lecanii RCEF 1005]
MGSRPELKLDDEGGFIRFFKSLPAVGDDTVRIFDRGDWYTSHGDDANLIANTVYKTTSVVRQLGRNDHTGLPSVTMTVTVFRQFLREALFKLGKRIEIWQSPNGRMNWKCTKQASPGNLQDVEEDLGGQIESAPMIMAVKISAKASEARAVGVCFADASVRELGVSEFLDNDLYSNFEALLIQLGVRECLLPQDKSEKDKDPELAKLRQIIDNCGVAIAERPVGEFGIRDIDQDLARLLKDEKATGLLPQTELKLAMGSAASLIKYLGILQDASNFGQYQLYQHDLAQFMKLDAAALKALNLMPGPRDGAKTMSIYGVLNHCKTPVGSRLLAQWLKQPLMKKEEIEKRQQLVEAFFADTELRQTMQETHLRSVPDLYRLSKRFQRGKANLEDVVRAYQVVIRLPGFIGTFEGVMDEAYRDPLDEAYTTKLRDLSDSLGRLQDMVEQTVDLDALDRHEYIIKPDYDAGLRVIRKKLDQLDRSIREEFRDAASDLGQEADKKIFLETSHKVHGVCMRLTRQEAGCIRNKSKYQECSTQKNGVYFTTKKLQTYRREHDQLSQNYNRTQSGLVHEVVQVAASYCPVLERLAGVLAHLDVIVSLAHCAVNAPEAYVRPTIHPRGEGQTRLIGARHPCLELQDDVQFITNDVALTRDKSSFLIITGPNMGGKSTYIRQVGTIALMAQVGAFVPCAEAELTIFDAILARVGASDSQLKGVSTFMAEMLETANILKSATSESLIIIDELGRGTSTYDGFGLAWAISEHIIKEIQCFALFATHFHELTALADQHPHVANLHVTAHIGGADDDAANDKREVTLLYKVEPGICDQSFGIHVAELVRFPDKVVRMAKRKADELEDFTSKHEDLGLSYSKTDVEEGSAMLKQLLVQWRAQVQDAGLSKEEQVAQLKVLVGDNEKLLANPFFQSVKAL